MEEARVEGGYSCYRVYRPKPVALHLSQRAKSSLQQVLVPTLSGEQIQQAFQLYYQPIVSLKTDRISGFEVLLRWQQPEQELSEGAEFVPLGGGCWGDRACGPVGLSAGLSATVLLAGGVSESSGSEPAVEFGGCGTGPARSGG